MKNTVQLAVIHEMGEIAYHIRTVSNLIRTSRTSENPIAKEELDSAAIERGLSAVSYLAEKAEKLASDQIPGLFDSIY